MSETTQTQTQNINIEEIRNELVKLEKIVAELNQKAAGRIREAILALKAYSDSSDFFTLFNNYSKIEREYPAYIKIEVWGITLVYEKELNGINDIKLWEIYKIKLNDIIKRVVEEVTIALNTLESSIDLTTLRRQISELEDRISELEGEEE